MPATEVSTDLVLAERRDAVLVLTLNRPDRMNAWNNALEQEYFAHLDAAEADEGVRAIVLTGAGRGFCGGADLDDFDDEEAKASVIGRARPRYFPMTIRKPLVAAINGAAAGLGLVEALYCDVRFCSAEAKLTTAFSRRGLIAEYGSAWLLPRMIGPGPALDLLMSGRVIRGEEGLRLGLVDRLTPPGETLEEAVAYADELARLSSPTAMAVIKGQVARALDQTFEAAMEDAEVEIAESLTRPDVTEGVASYFERREPAFQPLEPRGA